MAARAPTANSATPTPTPDRSPPLPDACGGGEKSAALELTAPSLTEKVRGLYEHSAVPVREIARLAGVTERTIYKYVEKHGWKRRYACAPRDKAVARANRGRRLRPQPGFEPVKGAGSRFIRREDRGKPVALGLKATDPAGRERAAAACVKAERLSAQAQAELRRERHADALIQAIDWTGAACRALSDYRATRAKQRQAQPTRKAQPKRQAPPGAVPLDERIERVYVRIIEIALARWNAVMDEGGDTYGADFRNRAELSAI